MQSLFFLIITMFQIGINKKITFNKHFAQKYIRAYTRLSEQWFGRSITPRSSLIMLCELNQDGLISENAQ